MIAQRFLLAILKRPETQIVAALALASLVPVIWDTRFEIQIATQICIFGLAAIGLNIALGYSGQLTIASVALMAIGGYTSGLLTLKEGWPFPLALAAAAILSTLAGLLLGIVTHRVRSHYLLLLTLGFHLIVLLVIVNERDLTGGANGLFPIPAAEIAGISFREPSDFYYLALIWLGLGIYCALHIRNSRVGRAMASLRQNEAAAQALGINIAYYKTMAMGLSGLYAGVAGALFGHMLNFLGPESFSLGQAIYLLVIVTLGGLASVWGTVAATIFIFIFRELIRDYSDISVMVYGLMIMFIMAVAPGGAAGITHRLLHEVRSRVTVLRGRGREPVTAVAMPGPTQERE